MKFFKKRIRPKAPPVVNSINIHEDDVGMRNLFPTIVSDALFAEMDKAIEASEENRSESGLGWDDIHVSKLPPVPAHALPDGEQRDGRRIGA